MSILVQCPICRRKQATVKKFCPCGEDLDKAKRSGRVKYWIAYRVSGKQRQEYVGTSIQEARDADGKRRGEKRDGTIFEMLPESKMTVSDLVSWYIGLESVKRLAAFARTKIALANFQQIYGDRGLKTIKPIDVENYQLTRINAGIAAVTVDVELAIVKAMINKAFDNDMISGRTLKAFRNVKKIATGSERARTRVLTVDEYQRLSAAAVPHLKAMLTVAYHTGMRPGELKRLKWAYIDRQEGFIRLPAEAVKEKRPKSIPINHHVRAALDGLPRHIDHDFVFTYGGKPVSGRKGPSDAFQTACRKAGIPCGKKTKNGIIPHDFRRTFKTNCVKAGIDKVYRDRLIGHSLRGMDVHYVVPSDEDLKAAMEKFTAWFDGQASANVDQIVDHENITN